MYIYIYIIRKLYVAAIPTVLEASMVISRLLQMARVEFFKWRNREKAACSGKMPTDSLAQSFLLQVQSLLHNRKWSVQKSLPLRKIGINLKKKAGKVVKYVFLLHACSSVNSPVKEIWSVYSNV